MDIDLPLFTGDTGSQLGHFPVQIPKGQPRETGRNTAVRSWNLPWKYRRKQLRRSFDETTIDKAINETKAWIRRKRLRDRGIYLPLTKFYCHR
jgi:hypothetical protein